MIPAVIPDVRSSLNPGQVVGSIASKAIETENERSSQSVATPAGIVQPQPPAIGIDRFPVTELAFSKHRSATLSALSSAVPARPPGVRNMVFLHGSGLACTPAVNSVSLDPGQTAFTPMFYLPRLSAATFVSTMAPPFDARSASIAGMVSGALTDDKSTIAPSIL